MDIFDWSDELGDEATQDEMDDQRVIVDVQEFMMGQTETVIDDDVIGKSAQGYIIGEDGTFNRAASIIIEDVAIERSGSDIIIDEGIIEKAAIGGEDIIADRSDIIIEDDVIQISDPIIIDVIVQKEVDLGTAPDAIGSDDHDIMRAGSETTHVIAQNTDFIGVTDAHVQKSAPIIIEEAIMHRSESAGTHGAVAEKMDYDSIDAAPEEKTPSGSGGAKDAALADDFIIIEEHILL